MCFCRKSLPLIKPQRFLLSSCENKISPLLDNVLDRIASEKNIRNFILPGYNTIQNKYEFVTGISNSVNPVTAHTVLLRTFQ